MKKLFKLFGDAITFDYTFSLVREKPDNSKREYLFGFICGKNNINRIVVFGIIVCLGENKDQTRGALASFFEIMGKNNSTIITDQSKAITGALQSLSEDGTFSGVHLYDAFHIIKALKIKSKELLELIRRMICARTSREYTSLYRQAEQIAENDDEMR